MLRVGTTSRRHRQRVHRFQLSEERTYWYDIYLSLLCIASAAAIAFAVKLIHVDFRFLHKSRSVHCEDQRIFAYIFLLLLRRRRILLILRI